jgi:deazaflavin-dependent oxidoreductase (nitroreductase family)
MADEHPAPGSAAGVDADLVGWDKAILLETRGRVSGVPRRVTVGFIEGPDDSLLVSAAGEETHWARNLLADPRCRVRRQDRWQDHVARQLDPEAHRVTVAALVLRYGTPAERLGSGPSFRLVPRVDGHPGS